MHLYFALWISLINYYIGQGHATWYPEGSPSYQGHLSQVYSVRQEGSSATHDPPGVHQPQGRDGDPQTVGTLYRGGGDGGSSSGLFGRHRETTTQTTIIRLTQHEIEVVISQRNTDFIIITAIDLSMLYHDSNANKTAHKQHWEAFYNGWNIRMFDRVIQRINKWQAII